MSSTSIVSQLIVTIEADPGKTSKQMEDKSEYFVAPASSALGGQAAVAVAADGIGGQAGGEEASRITVETIEQYFLNSPTSDPSKTISDAIEAAHDAIVRHKGSNPAIAGMGSTVTVAVIAADRLFLGSVGDSRAYLVRAGEIKRITTDHTWVQEALDAGRITPEEAKVHPNRHVLRRYLGMPGTVTPDIRPVEFLWPGDTVLLCTDGLTDLIEDSEIRGIVTSRTPKAATRRLLGLALERGGFDNITVVSMKLPGPSTRVAAPAGWHSLLSSPIAIGALVVSTVLLLGIFASLVLLILRGSSGPVPPTPTIAVAVLQPIRTSISQPTPRPGTFVPTVTPLPTYTPVPQVTPFTPPPPPAALGPINGQIFEGAGAQVILTWSPPPVALPPDVYYVVTLRKFVGGVQVANYEIWTRETKIQLPPDAFAMLNDSDRYRGVAWNIGPAQAAGAIVAVGSSEIRFEWFITIERLTSIDPDGTKHGVVLTSASSTMGFTWRAAVSTITPVPGRYP